MRQGNVGIGRPIWWFGMAGNTVVRICLRVEIVTGQAAGDDLGPAGGDNIRGNLMATQAVGEITACSSIVVVVWTIVRCHTRAAGVAGSGLPQAIGKGRAETTGSGRERRGATLADIVAEGAGRCSVASGAVRKCTASLPVSRMCLGKSMTTGTGCSL